jgi:Anti-sigma-K factor rskA
VPIAAHREALSLLTPSSDPPPRLWQAIAAKLEEHIVSDAPVAPVVPIGSRRRTFVAVTAAAAALVAVSVGVTLALEHRGGLGAAAAAVLIVSHATPGVRGEATLYRPTSPDGVVVVDLARIAPPPAGDHYEVWVLRAGGGGSMEAVGSFSPHSGSARLQLPLPGPGTYAALDRSLQQDGGPATHSSISVAGATF